MDEPESNNKATATTNITDKTVKFSHITAVATGWMLDFSFVSLCRHFKEGEVDEFTETLSTFQAIAEGHSLKTDHGQKRMICAFLARIMHGKDFDVQFEEDDSVMPLMSAASIWPALRDTVADESLFENIANLLFVQSVAVCLEKGQRSMASSALKWFEKKHDFPQNLRVKLSTIVTQRDTYHPFLLSFSFSRLLETVRSYLDAYLEKNPSDYLLQAATKMVQSSQNMEAVEDVVTRDESLSETTNNSTEKDAKNKKSSTSVRAKKKLLSTKITDVWKPESCKKPRVVLNSQAISKSEMARLTFQQESPEKSLNTSKTKKPRRPPKKWTRQLDKNLKDGVKLHGVGKWSRILLDYDFEGRTGTMLKDRWRVLMKTYEVS
uniref:telomeric repeat-binding factor 1 n=1 Tax=Centroberyx gerrardi TaxID=166262 RepID=UPI003AAA7D48